MVSEDRLWGNLRKNAKNSPPRNFLLRIVARSRQHASSGEPWPLATIRFCSGYPKAFLPTLICIVLIAVLGFAVYANSLSGEFIWDDKGLIEENTYIRSPSYIPKIFSENIGAGNIREGGGEKSTFSYRPLQMCTYMIDYMLWRSDVRGYHLTNILLHILTAVLIYLFINILFKDNIIALLTGILFVVHPIHTEAVAYISGRADPLASIFMLSCLILYVKNIKLNNRVISLFLPLSYIFAILSRENSIILPALLLLYHFSFKKRVDLKQFLPIVSISLLYLILRLTLLQTLLPHVSSHTTLLQRVPGFFLAITDYIRLLILPLGLHMEYGEKLFNITDPRAISGAIILFSLLAYAFWRRRTTTLVSFSIFWFFIALLPSSNLYPVKAYMAEHWLYLPSIGFFLIAANILRSLYERKGFKILAVIIMAGVAGIYSFLTVRQNIYWKEPIPFYERTLRYAPGSIKAYFNLANLYKDNARYEEAIELYEKTIKHKPDFPDAYINLGVIYYELGRYEEALSSYKKAIGLDGNYQGAYYNLGNAYKAIGEDKDAIISYKKATELNPDYADAYNNLGNLYRKVGRREDAIVSYKKVLEIDPDLAYVYSNLALTYYDAGKHKEAIALYKKAIGLDPQYAYAYNNLGMAYYRMGEYKEAIRYTERAIEIDPGYRSAYFNLSLVYYSDGKFDMAIQYCDKALAFGHKADPEFLKRLEPHRKKNYGA